MSEVLLKLEEVHTHIGAYHILHGVDLVVPKGQAAAANQASWRGIAPFLTAIGGGTAKVLFMGDGDAEGARGPAGRDRDRDGEGRGVGPRRAAPGGGDGGAGGERGVGAECGRSGDGRRGAGGAEWGGRRRGGGRGS